MKKVLSVLIAVLFITMIPACITSLAAVGNAEIQFCVGDSVLTINGVSVTVEKPYVVGIGVTLVPIRVITEAFGAEVGWENETKTVSISHPEANIVLQIGNPTATVNGVSSELLAAPELSAGGYTMVPLRFISENFGASVSYDDATKKITILKSTSPAAPDYELSAPQDGCRRFTAKNLGISFNVLEDLVLDEDSIKENYYSFKSSSPDDAVTEMSLVVYSKSSVTGAKDLADKDFLYNKTTINEDIMTFDSSVHRYIYGTLITYGYNYIIDSAFYKERNSDMFFEHGDYVYNLSFCFNKTYENDDDLFTYALYSIEFFDINPANAGVFIKPAADSDAKIVSSKIKNCSVLIPRSYSERAEKGVAQYTNPANGVVITAWVDYKNGGFAADDMKTIAEEVEKKQTAIEGTSSVLPLTEDVIKKHAACKYIVCSDNTAAKERKYIENFYILNETKKCVYVFSIEYPEISYSAKAKNDVRSILETIEFT